MIWNIPRIFFVNCSSFVFFYQNVIVWVCEIKDWPQVQNLNGTNSKSTSRKQSRGIRNSCPPYLLEFSTTNLARSFSARSCRKMPLNYAAANGRLRAVMALHDPATWSFDYEPVTLRLYTCTQQMTYAQGSPNTSDFATPDILYGVKESIPAAVVLITAFPIQSFRYMLGRCFVS